MSTSVQSLVQFANVYMTLRLADVISSVVPWTSKLPTGVTDVTDDLTCDLTWNTLIFGALELDATDSPLLTASHPLKRARLTSRWDTFSTHMDLPLDALRKRSV